LYQKSIVACVGVVMQKICFIKLKIDPQFNTNAKQKYFVWVAWVPVLSSKK